MATIRKKRDKWAVSIRRSFHKPLFKSFASKQDAERWAVKTERLIEIGQYQDMSEANKTTLQMLLERYEREVSSKKRTKADKQYIKNILKQKAMTEWQCYIAENPVKPRLRCEENPRRVRRLEPGEYEKLMSSCKMNRAFWCPIIDFAIHTAMRRGELLEITWDMIHMDLKYITLPEQITKTKRVRNVPLQPNALEVLRKLPRSLNGRVFPIGIKNFERSWTAICKRSGVKGLRFHDLKREAISRLFEKGLSVSEVQLFCGNSLSSLSVYTQHNSTTLAKKLAQ